MVLHLPHTEGGFSVPFNCVTKDAAFYTTTSRFVVWIGAFPQERQELWLPKDDLRDSSSWSSPPLVLLRDIHSKLLTQFDCKEVCSSSPSQGNTGAGARQSSQDGVSQQQETATLKLPQLNRLIEASFVRDESSASNADVTTVIPAQSRVTQQILSHWQPFRDLKLMFAGSRRAVSVSSSTSWLGQIRPHRRDESWSASLWQTFVSKSMGAQIPVMAEKSLTTCGWRKFQLDPLGDHLNTCTAHSGAKKAHDWMVDQLADLFRTTHKVKTQQVVKNRGQLCGDIELAGYLANETGPVP
jgi:hypothetical protein